MNEAQSSKNGAVRDSTGLRMKDIARHAGVSIITVSRVVNRPQQVAEKTKQKVLSVMSELGYTPNRIAGGLASTRSRIIAAVVPYIQEGIFADIVRGINDILREENYSLLLGTVAMAPDEEELLITNLLGMRPAGIILHGGNHTTGTRLILKRAGIPVIETGELVADPIDMVVGYSNFEASKAMVEYLYSRGYRKIAFVCHNTQGNDRAAERLRGYLAAAKELGLPSEANLRVETTIGIRSGAEALRLLVHRAPDIDSIFCAGEMWALGAIFECQRQGISIPSQIAVAGCDDQPIASQIVPSLTTIHLPRYEIGQRAARLLIGALQERSLTKTIVKLDFEIISRDSA